LRHQKSPYTTPSQESGLLHTEFLCVVAALVTDDLPPAADHEPNVDPPLRPVSLEHIAFLTTGSKFVPLEFPNPASL
jgi:hypothetical protein